MNAIVQTVKSVVGTEGYYDSPRERRAFQKESTWTRARCGAACGAGLLMD